MQQAPNQTKGRVFRKEEQQESEFSKGQGEARASNLHGCWAANFSDLISPQIFGVSQSPFQSDKPRSTGQQNVRVRNKKQEKKHYRLVATKKETLEDISKQAPLNPSRNCHFRITVAFLGTTGSTKFISSDLVTHTCNPFKFHWHRSNYNKSSLFESSTRMIWSHSV